MNYLQLTNRLRQECGVSGPDLVTVQGLPQTNEAARLANWVAQAWQDIASSKEDWNFLQEAFSFNTIANQRTYTPAQVGVGSTFGNWKRDSFRCSSVGANFGDEQLLNYMEWPTYRNLYEYASMRDTFQRPVVVSIVPGSKSLAFGAAPDQPYVIVGEYYKAPHQLVMDADVPTLPERFHMIVVYRAMMYYAGYESAPEVYQRGEFEFRRMESRLLIDQLPTMVSGPPLA